MGFGLCAVCLLLCFPFFFFRVQPVRDHFKNDPDAKKLLSQVKVRALRSLKAMAPKLRALGPTLYSLLLLFVLFALISPSGYKTTVRSVVLVFFLLMPSTACNLQSSSRLTICAMDCACLALQAYKVTR